MESNLFDFERTLYFKYIFASASLTKGNRSAITDQLICTNFASSFVDKVCLFLVVTREKIFNS